MAGAMISITEEGNGAVKFQARLRALEENLAAMPLASKAVMDELDRYTAANWGRGVVVTEATEERWPEWQPLYNTGALKESLTHTGAPGAIREVTPYGFRWGTSIPYAKFLYKGTRKMASKPVVNLRGMRAVVGYTMHRWILRNVGPGGI